MNHSGKDEKRALVYHDAPSDPAIGASNRAFTSPVVGRQELLHLRPDLEAIYDAADASFPVRVTRSWWSRLDPHDPNDPLAKQVLPDASELLQVGGDLDDPVGEQGLSPVPWLVQKHDDRVLLLLTKRCHVYCRYCFRRTFDPGDQSDPTAAELDTAISAAISSGAREVILSGGDPLAVRDTQLWSVIDRLREGGISIVRIHTRAPVSYPSRVTDAFVAGLRRRRPLWVVIHVNHAAELAPDVDLAIAKMIDAGLPVLNQSVLLKGVNDNVEALEKLCIALVERGVKPYYLHHTDAVTGNAAFRVETARGQEIYEALRTRLSGIALPRFVVDPPDGSGKVDVSRWRT